MQTLRTELKLVSEAAPPGSHKKVAKKLGYSDSYIQQVRDGIKATLDNLENRKLIQDSIKEYRRLIRKEQDKLNKI